MGRHRFFPLAPRQRGGVPEGRVRVVELAKKFPSSAAAGHLLPVSTGRREIGAAPAYCLLA